MTVIFAIIFAALVGAALALSWVLIATAIYLYKNMR